MFIGTVLKSLEIEDLVCCNKGSRPCYLARSFFQSADTPKFSEAGTSSSNLNELSSSEGDDKFYEAPENLPEPADCGLQSPRVLEHESYQDSHHSQMLSLRPPSFTRIAGLLPGDTLKPGIVEFEPSATMDSFVKAQIIIYDQNSAIYNDIDKQVGFGTPFNVKFFWMFLLG